MDFRSANLEMYNSNVIRDAEKTACAPTTTTTPSNSDASEERCTAVLCATGTHPFHIEGSNSLRSNTKLDFPYYCNTHMALEMFYNEASATLRRSVDNIDEIQMRVRKIIYEIQQSDMVYNHLRLKDKALALSIYENNECNLQKNMNELDTPRSRPTRCLQYLPTIPEVGSESDIDSHKRIEENLAEPMHEKHSVHEQEDKIIVKKEEAQKSLQPMLQLAGKPLPVSENHNTPPNMTSINVETKKCQLPRSALTENKTLDRIRLCNTSKEKPENSRTGLKYIGILDEIELKDLLPYKSEYPRRDVHMDKPASGDQFSFLRELVYGSLQDYLLTLIQIQPDLVHSAKNLILMRKYGSTDISTWKLAASEQKPVKEKLHYPSTLTIMPILITDYTNPNYVNNMKALSQKHQMISCSRKCGSGSGKTISRSKPQEKSKSNIQEKDKIQSPLNTRNGSSCRQQNESTNFNNFLALVYITLFTIIFFALAFNYTCQ